MEELGRTPKQIGAIIKRIRRNKNLTQQELAVLVGLTQPMISLIESGEKPANIANILMILAALDLEFRVCERTKNTALSIEEIF